MTPLHIAPAGAHAEAIPAALGDSAGFVVRRGADTVLVERARRAGDTLAVTLVDARQGGARVALTAVLARDEGVAALDAQVWPPHASAGAPPAQTSHAVVRGDTITTTDRNARLAGTADSVRRAQIATRPGVVPYYNGEVALLEQLVRRVRGVRPGAPRDAAASVPVFVLGGGRTVGATVAPLGADSVAVTLAGTEFRLRVGGDGAVLGGAVPARGVTIERVSAAAVADLVDAGVRAGAEHGAPAGAPYAAENVTVRSPDGPTLAGTLTLPRGVARAPAVVLISGSSPHDRDYTGPRGYRLFAWLADTLSRCGIAVLRLDNRGVGGSTGNHDSATTAQRAGDVRAAVALLRARPDVDGARVGLVGISEGGLIAPMLAAEDPTLRGIVLLAAPGESGRAIARYQYGFRIARDSTVRPAARDSALADRLRRADAASAALPWARWLWRYDPLATARRVRRTPVLLLQGTTDQSVPPADAARLAAAFRATGNRDVTARLLPGLDHIFVPDPAGDVARYDAFPSLRVSGAVLGLVTDWTAERLAAAPR